MTENDSITVEENDSKIPAKKTSNYFKLLQDIDNILILSSDLNSVNNVNENTSNIEKIDIILNDLEKSLKSIIDKMIPEKRAIFLIMVFNKILHICTVDKSDTVISRPCFQYMIHQVLDSLTYIVRENPDDYQHYATDMLDSLLTYLGENDLVELCLGRLVSNKIVYGSTVATGTHIYNLICNSIFGTK